MKLAASTTFFCMTAALLAATCFAQSEEKKSDDQVKYYRLDYVVKELDAGKVVNSRAYMSTLSSKRGDFVDIRTGDKVPIQNGGTWTFIDIGVNIHTSDIRQVENHLAMNVNADISSMASDEPSARPLVRQTKWTSTAIVPARKATTIFSADGASFKRQTQLEVTITPIP